MTGSNFFYRGLDLRLSGATHCRVSAGSRFGFWLFVAHLDQTERLPDSPELRFGRVKSAVDLFRWLHRVGDDIRER
jgi:hypothetical protein